MTDDATTLTTKQRTAIRALLAGSTYQEAAEAAGVRPNTITTWMRDPSFILELRQAEQEALEEITRQLLAEGAKSIQTIKKIRDDYRASAATRLRAADIILEKLLHLTELVQLEQRIAALESEREE